LNTKKKLFKSFKLLFLIINCGGGNVNDFYNSIPDKIDIWEKSDDDARYGRETLYNYMNGGVELYLAFDFREVFVRRFADREDNEGDRQGVVA